MGQIIRNSGAKCVQAIISLDLLPLLILFQYVYTASQNIHHSFKFQHLISSFLHVFQFFSFKYFVHVFYHFFNFLCISLHFLQLFT